MTLVRGISRAHLVALTVNSIVGAGILGLPSRAFALSGTYSLLAWLVCAVLVTGIALCFAEASGRFRESGGPYLYALRAFGPSIGIVTGWLTWVSRVLAFATIVNLLVDYAGAIPGVPGGEAWRAALIASVVGALTVVLIAGIRQTAWASTLLAAAKLAVLATLVVAALLVHGTTAVAFGAPPALHAFSATVAIVLFAFFGFETATIAAGETADPQRNMPFAILVSVAIVTMCYVLVQYSAIAAVPGLVTSTRPVADLATQLFGPWGGAAVAAGAVVMMMGTMLGVLLAASRMLMAMAEQQQLPGALAGLHPRLRTPVFAIVISSGAVLVASWLSTFTAAVTIAVATRLFTYVVVCLAVPALRRTSAVRSRFQTPLGMPIAVGSAVLSASLFATTTLFDLAITLLVAVLGWAMWVGYDRMRKRSASLPAPTSPV